MHNLRALLVLGSLLTPSFAADAARDFSGNWILMYERSNTRALGGEPEPFLTITGDAKTIHCSSTLEGEAIQWLYRLDGSDSRYKIGHETRNSAVKWEGAALLINTLVSGPLNYTVMDRWRLSEDHALLTVTRQVVRANGEAEGSLVYRRAGAAAPARRPDPTNPSPVLTPRHAAPSEAAPEPPRKAPVLQPRPAPAAAAQGEATVAAGTHVLLELLNPLNTKQSHDGDRVYLRTAVPVAVSNRVVIPRGSNVNGVVVETKDGKGKGALYIRFDSITLPNGVTRDLRSRPDGGSEGKIASASDHSGDLRRASEGAGIGAGVGSLGGLAAGRPGIGAGVGAIAGLGAVFAKGKPGQTLPKGTTVDMALDRDLKFTWEELR
jgi:type IV secretion system protein VirB10